MPWSIDYVHGTYLRNITFTVSASTRSPTPSGGTTSADVPALCRRERHAAPGRVQHHHRQQYHAVHLEEGSKGEGGEAAPAQSLHVGQQNRVQGHLQIRLRVSTMA